MFDKREKTLMVFLIIIVFFTSIFLKNNNFPVLNVSTCKWLRTLGYYNFYRFNESENKIYGIILSNCGIKEYKINLQGNRYIIEEIGKPEDITRCVCEKEFEIKNAKDYLVYHLPFGEKEPIQLEKLK